MTAAAVAKADWDAERELMAIPAANPRTLKCKLDAFEAMLADDLQFGQRADDFLMVAFGAIKTDIATLG